MRSLFASSFLLLITILHQFYAIPLSADEKNNGGGFQVAISFVESARAQPEEDDGSIRLRQMYPYDFTHKYLVGPVIVGTAKPGEKPQQLGNVIFTLATADFWVQDTMTRRTKKCYWERDPVDTFSPADSTSFQTVANHFEIHTSHLDVFGTVGMDKVQIGLGPLLIARNATIGVALYYDCFFIENSISGVLGLGWPQLAQDPALGRASPFINALGNLPKPLFSLFIDSTTGNGSIAFGHLDKANCQNEWKFAPVSKTAFWQLETTAYSIGPAFSNRTRQQAILSESIGKILGDKVDIDELAIQLGPSAAYQDLLHAVTINCEYFHEGKLPDVRFQLADGLQLTLSPEEYMSPNDISAWLPGQCLTYFGYRTDLVRSGLFPGDLDGINWVIGRPVMAKYCTSYDFGQKQVGFALAKKA